MILLEIYWLNKMVLKLIYTCFFYFFNVTTRKSKFTYVDCIKFLLGSAGLEYQVYGCVFLPWTASSLRMDTTAC